jgi:hypothetical protein
MQRQSARIGLSVAGGGIAVDAQHEPARVALDAQHRVWRAGRQIDGGAVRCGPDRFGVIFEVVEHHRRLDLGGARRKRPRRRPSAPFRGGLPTVVLVANAQRILGIGKQARPARMRVLEHAVAEMDVHLLDAGDPDRSPDALARVDRPDLPVRRRVRVPGVWIRERCCLHVHVAWVQDLVGLRRLGDHRRERRLVLREQTIRKRGAGDEADGE